MGSIHNELRRGSWSQAASAILGDTREGSGIERMGESMTPVIDLWNPARPDWTLYRREKGVYLHAASSAVAAELAAVVFEAPLSGNSILIVDELHVTCGVTSSFNIGYDIRPAGSAAATTKDFLDTRGRDTTAARPRSNVYSDSNAATALTGPFFRITIPAGITQVYKCNFVLLGVPPLINANVLIVEHQTVNVAFSATAFGRERELLTSEV